MTLARFGPRVALAGVLLSAVLAAGAAPSPSVAREIDYLLEQVRGSSCLFVRNGTPHAGPQARQHMDRKYRYLDERGAIETAEDFIDKAASHSSASGQPYSVQCPGQPAVSSKAWLTERLARYRLSRLV